MIRISERLDTIDFDALFEIARSQLPILAPEWTDYNYSDPGITLVDLLAWIADSQIYSLARNRRDEQLAMAALLGLTSVGAIPAAGVVCSESAATPGQKILAGTRLIPVDGCAPRLEVAHDVRLSGLRIHSVTSEGPGSQIDHTAANEQARATYAPFGDPPASSVELVVALDGEIGDEPVTLCVGFELDQDDETDSTELGGVLLGYEIPGGSKVPLEPIFDSTAKLRRSGVMVLPLPEAANRGSHHRLTFRSEHDALLPRLRRIAPDALPVLQLASLTPEAFSGTGRAGQAISVAPLPMFGPEEAAEGYIWRLAAGADGPALGVEVQEGMEFQTWRPGKLADAANNDQFYETYEREDGTCITVRFGNGVNGRRPDAGAQIRIKAAVSAGGGGNIAAGVNWVLDGSAARWINREPIEGGRNADDLSGLLTRLRGRLRSERTLATSAQIEAAARSLPKAFAVDRATVIEGWEPGRRRPAAPATRTLLVTRKVESSRRVGVVETDDWRRAIARRLRPHVALAERLIVASPNWRELRVRVAAVAAPGRRPADVAGDIQRELMTRFAPSGAPKKQWPLGRDVTATAVGGWLRRLPGVAAITELTLLDGNGSERSDNVLRLGRADLPLYVGSGADIAVAAGGGR